jgi:predicted DsbA family dithiol-disulfide isomerase
MMKKAFQIPALFLAIVCCMSIGPNVQAGIDWKEIKEVKLDARPLDTVVSDDEKQVFILTPEEIVVYSNTENKVTGKIKVGKNFDHLAISPKNNMLILSNGNSNTIKFIKYEFIHEIDTTGLPFKGAENAPVVVAVFDDYQCPYCARLVPILYEVTKKYPDKVKLVIKHFPLSFHTFANKAAKAALAADRQGKFWELNDMLFKNQSELSDEKIIEIAKGLNLDIEKFKKDMESESVNSLIARDMANAQSIGVRGTPAVYINGRLLKQRSLKGFENAIEDELKNKK